MESESFTFVCNECDGFGCINCTEQEQSEANNQQRKVVDQISKKMNNIFAENEAVEREKLEKIIKEKDMKIKSLIEKVSELQQSILILSLVLFVTLLFMSKFVFKNNGDRDVVQKKQMEIDSYKTLTNEFEQKLHVLEKMIFHYEENSKVMSQQKKRMEEVVAEQKMHIQQAMLHQKKQMEELMPEQKPKEVMMGEENMIEKLISQLKEMLEKLIGQNTQQK